MYYLQVVVVIPEVPGFAGDIKAESAIKTIMAAQYRSMNRGGSSIYEEVRKAGYEPYVIFDSSKAYIYFVLFRMDYIRFYHLRSYDRINAPEGISCSFYFDFMFIQYNLGFIKQMEQNSGVKFHEAQVALSRQWVAGDSLTTQKEIVVVIPQEEHLLPAGKPQGAATEKIPIPVDDQAARRVVARFEAGATNLRSDDVVSDTVSQHMLADRTSLFDEAWLGTEQEELNA